MIYFRSNHVSCKVVRHDCNLTMYGTWSNQWHHCHFNTKPFLWESDLTMIWPWFYRNDMNSINHGHFISKSIYLNSVILQPFQGAWWPWSRSEMAGFQLTYLIKPCFINGHNRSKISKDMVTKHGFTMVCPWVFLQGFLLSLVKFPLAVHEQMSFELFLI